MLIFLWCYLTLSVMVLCTLIVNRNTRQKFLQSVLLFSEKQGTPKFVSYFLFVFSFLLFWAPLLVLSVGENKDE